MDLQESALIARSFVDLGAERTGFTEAFGSQFLGGALRDFDGNKTSVCVIPQSISTLASDEPNTA